MAEFTVDPYAHMYARRTSGMSASEVRALFAVAAACRQEASRAFETLGLRDVARTDVMIDVDGRPWLVDVNVSPGMTDTSLLPMAARAAGIDLPELCDRLVRLALQRSSAIPN